MTRHPLPSPTTKTSPAAAKGEEATHPDPSTTPAPAAQSQSRWPFGLTSGSTPLTAASTDRLSQEIRRARLFLYRHTSAAETSLNTALARGRDTEFRIANTIRSLAPAPDSGERLLPGAIYVGVSGMGGSILARNRGLLLRAATPVGISTVAAYALLPVTMRNVGQLVFEYERRVPGLAEKHVAARERMEHIYHTGVAHSAMTVGLLEQRISDGRKTVEEWLKKGE